MPVSSLYFRIISAIISLVIIFVVYMFVNTLPPTHFASGTIVHIEKNSSLTSVAKILVQGNIIRSPFIFRSIATIKDGGRAIAAGDYLFKSPVPAWTVVGRLLRGDQGLDAVKITFPEGVTVHMMGDTLVKNIPAFNLKTFISIASSSKAEGYFFPDTYLFYPNVTPEKVVSTLRATFDQKIKTLTLPKDHSLKDIVIVASIVEKEANSFEDRRIIAGVLWKRIAAGKPLQVDPPFAYFLGKSSDDLTLDDLKTDSPYNTYKYKGLPPTPIDNPGIEAIKATISPTETKYWFYLSDKKGVMHYAATYDGHLANRAAYLGK